MSEEKDNVTVSVFEKLEQQIKDLGTEEPISEKVLQPVVEENGCEVVEPSNDEPSGTVDESVTPDYSTGTVSGTTGYVGDFVSHGEEETSEIKNPEENKKINWEKKSKTTPSTQVWLNETQRSIARVIGEGKISTGIKVALDFYIKNHEVS